MKFRGFFILLFLLMHLFTIVSDLQGIGGMFLFLHTTHVNGV